MTNIKKGDCVKPLNRLKREKSSWARTLGYGKKYPVIDIDHLAGERVLVLETGPGSDDYEIVYPDEVVKVHTELCRRK